MIITESKISSIVAMITLIGMSLNTVAVIPKVNAASFRTKYKIYGDLNGDNIGIVKKCAVEENPKSEIDRYQAA